MSATPRIYVASLSDYAAGRLHGEWIDANQSPGMIRADISTMLDRSPSKWAEEFAIHDYEGFGDIRLSEYEDIAKVSELAQAIVLHGPAVAAYASDQGLEFFTLEGFEDSYQGEYDSLADYAQELAEELGSDTENDAGMRWPFTCIDWECAGEELELGGDIWTAKTSNYGVYVFRSI